MKLLKFTALSEAAKATHASNQIDALAVFVCAAYVIADHYAGIQTPDEVIVAVILCASLARLALRNVRINKAKRRKKDD